MFLAPFTQRHTITETAPCGGVHQQFLLTVDISLHWRTAICLSIHLLMDAWVVSGLWPWWTKLLWTSVKCSCMPLFSPLLRKHLGMELLGSIVSIHLIWKETVDCFANELYHFTFSTEEDETSTYATYLPTFTRLLNFSSVSGYTTLVHYGFKLFLPD